MGDMNRKNLGLRIGLGVALLCTLAASAALAQGRGRGRETTPPAVTVVVKGEFGPRDREIITVYYGQPASGLPPGLAKRDEGLPPGLEKQLRRNGTLPPGLQKKIQPFPIALERRLTPLPSGYRRGIVGAHIVVYVPRTNVIVDVMLNVVR
jgi:hypothetical protein